MRSLNRLVGIENPEPASRNNRHNIATAEAQVRVGREGRILNHFGAVTVRIRRLWREVVGEDRIIGRERCSDYLIHPNTGPGERTIQSTKEAGGVGRIGIIEQSRLLHGAAHLAEAKELNAVAHAAPKLVFHVSAPGEEESSESQNGERGKDLTHKSIFV